MKILITGSNGFVGSSLMFRLEELGHVVYGIDRDDSTVYVKHQNTIIENIFNINSIKKLNTAYDLIIHCAAAKSDFGISRKEYYEDNEDATKIIVDFATSNGVNNIIYYSTVSVYGHQDFRCDESGKLLSNTVYGDSKLAGEKAIENWLEQNPKNKAVFLRPSVIYGPNNYANMYNLIDRLYGKPLFMIGTGQHIKSMVALRNLVNMTVFVIHNGFEKKLNVYNCIDKPYIKVIEIIRIISEVEGFNLPKINIPIWLAYIFTAPFELVSKLTGKDLKINWNRLSKFNASTDYAAEKMLTEGYEQQYSTREEIIRMAEWYKTIKK